LARSKGAWGVAVAHHREDQAETVLDRFLRGAGPKGLSGLKPFQELFPVKGGPPLKIWRPLLPYTKDEIREYLRKHSIPWKEDRTNRRNLYRRNQIRNQILPYLSRWNPNLTEVLSRIGDILALEDQYLEGLLPAVERKVSPRWKRNSFECPAAKLEKIHLALKRRFVRGVAVRLNPQARGLSFERIEEVLGLWDGRVTGPRDIGYGLSADRRHGSAFLRWNG
jgi:tRNA(Ile)-lysidine synthase